MWEPASFLTAMTENKGKWTRTSWGGASRTVSRTTLVKAKRWTSARENGFLEPVKIQGMDIQNDRSYKVNWAIGWTRLTTQMHFTERVIADSICWGHGGTLEIRQHCWGPFWTLWWHQPSFTEVCSANKPIKKGSSAEVVGDGMMMVKLDNDPPYRTPGSVQLLLPPCVWKRGAAGPPMLLLSGCSAPSRTQNKLCNINTSSD